MTAHQYKWVDGNLVRRATDQQIYIYHKHVVPALLRDEQRRLREEEKILARERAEVEAAKRRWAELGRKGGYKSPYQRVEDRAAAVFGVSRHELKSGRRHKHVVLARQFICYWACRLTPFSLPQIGKCLGGRDHTTVMHGRNAYREKRAKMGRHLPPAR